MTTMGAFEAKTHFSSILEKVTKGEEVIITKHGHAIAKIIPFNIQPQSQIDEVIDWLQCFKTGKTLADLRWKKLRDEGQR